MSLRELLDAPRTDAESGAAAPSRSLRSALAGAERELWILTALAMSFDIVLTIYGLSLGLTETNPVARSALEAAGAVGLSGLKLAAVAVGLACLPLLPTRYRALVPLALAIPSVCAVFINTLLIGSVLL